MFLYLQDNVGWVWNSDKFGHFFTLLNRRENPIITLDFQRKNFNFITIGRGRQVGPPMTFHPARS